MSKIHYEFPVKCVHGKISKDDKICLKKLEAYGTCYGVKRDDWTMQYKTEAAATAARQRQAKFRAVVLAAKERKVDPTKKTADEAAFAAQTRYKTMWAYLFHLEWLAYEG